MPITTAAMFHQLITSNTLQDALFALLAAGVFMLVL